MNLLVDTYPSQLTTYVRCEVSKALKIMTVLLGYDTMSFCHQTM